MDQKVEAGQYLVTFLLQTHFQVLSSIVGSSENFDFPM